MRTCLFVLLLALAATSFSCSNPAPRPTTAVIVVRAPASIAARVCPRCGDLVGELEAVADLVIEETAGVGGQVTGINVLLANGTGPIEGPGVLDVASILSFGAPTVRISANGSLRIPEIGVHFAAALRDRLPGTLRFTVNFRDDNGHTVSADVVIQVTP